METHPNTPAHPGGPAVAPPGDLAIWFFILAELLAFGVFFAAYAFGRAHNVELFNEMQQTLDRQAGALNTVLLITGSWCVARGVEAVERARSATGARWLAAASSAAAAWW
jgi:nitric oxide reductase NorE protein